MKYYLLQAPLYPDYSTGNWTIVEGPYIDDERIKAERDRVEYQWPIKIESFGPTTGTTTMILNEETLKKSFRDFDQNKKIPQRIGRPYKSFYDNQS